ncbi:unnamed protein product [Adineta ricciae]|uniref:Uncharacterized protein n=1 Tax=Adineta ricciae TaxID=249248 RepID=A0A813VF37_ADIRI|nr:unnamed protein product [Adineta ricciae]
MIRSSSYSTNCLTISAFQCTLFQNIIFYDDHHCFFSCGDGVIRNNVVHDSPKGKKEHALILCTVYHRFT